MPIWTVRRTDIRNCVHSTAIRECTNLAVQNPALRYTSAIQGALLTTLHDSTKKTIASEAMALPGLARVGTCMP
eukprot:2484465-Pyramimonas_sp.AAC.3